jgi:hypothetical protein
MSRQIKADLDTQERIIRLYQEGNSLKECEAKSGAGSMTVRNVLKKARVQMRPRGQQEGKPEGNLIGRVFGYLRVIRFSIKRRGKALLWECECQCGETVFRSHHALHRTETPSCGCYSVERATGMKLSHGMRDHPDYVLWQGMNAR